MSATGAGRKRPVDATERRAAGLRRLPDMLGRLLDGPARQRGLVDSALLTDWPLIVGADLARRCQPVRLARDQSAPVLHLRVSATAALEVQHSAPQIIERINDHFGFPAVARLRLVQAPVARPPQRRRPLAPAPSAETLAAIDDAVAPVEDVRLREALAGLGRALSRTARGT